MNRKASFILFVLLAAAQLGVPVHMIARGEWTLACGESFKFRLRASGPYDGFLGQSLRLSFKDDDVAAPPDMDLRRGQDAYVLLSPDEAGFARLSSLRLERPDVDGYINASVRYVSDHGQMHVTCPFLRYYPEKELAPRTERALREAFIHGRPVHATVRVHRGLAVLEELYVDGKTLREFARGHRDDDPEGRVPPPPRTP